MYVYTQRENIADTNTLNHFNIIVYFFCRWNSTTQFTLLCMHTYTSSRYVLLYIGRIYYRNFNKNVAHTRTIFTVFHVCTVFAAYPLI